MSAMGTAALTHRAASPAKHSRTSRPEPTAVGRNPRHSCAADKHRHPLCPSVPAGLMDPQQQQKAGGEQRGCSEKAPLPAGSRPVGARGAFCHLLKLSLKGTAPQGRNYVTEMDLSFTS